MQQYSSGYGYNYTVCNSEYVRTFSFDMLPFVINGMSNAFARTILGDSNAQIGTTFVTMPSLIFTPSMTT